MPSGTKNDEERFCRICDKQLRPLYKNKDWENKKYKHRKKIHDVYVDDMKPDHKFVINWD